MEVVGLVANTLVSQRIEELPPRSHSTVLGVGLAGLTLPGPAFSWGIFAFTAAAGLGRRRREAGNKISTQEEGSTKPTLLGIAGRAGHGRAVTSPAALLGAVPQEGGSDPKPSARCQQQTPSGQGAGKALPITAAASRHRRGLPGAAAPAAQSSARPRVPSRAGPVTRPGD